MKLRSSQPFLRYYFNKFSSKKLFRVYVIVFAIAVIAMLPGRIEGQYCGIGISCLCNCVHILQFRDGKILYYGSNHPPALIFGRYDRTSDGSVAMYVLPNEVGGPEVLIGHATPHLLATKFTWPDSSGEEWGLKHPKIFTVGRTISEQEITSSEINADRSITTKYYDSSLRVIRTETTVPKKRPAEEDSTSNDE